MYSTLDHINFLLVELVHSREQADLATDLRAPFAWRVAYVYEQNYLKMYSGTDLRGIRASSKQLKNASPLWEDRVSHKHWVLRGSIQTPSALHSAWLWALRPQSARAVVSYQRHSSPHIIIHQSLALSFWSSGREYGNVHTYLSISITKLVRLNSTRTGT